MCLVLQKTATKRGGLEELSGLDSALFPDQVLTSPPESPRVTPGHQRLLRRQFNQVPNLYETVTLSRYQDLQSRNVRNVQ